jgi:hypothetical protein
MSKQCEALQDEYVECVKNTTQPYSWQSPMRRGVPCVIALEEILGAQGTLETFPEQEVIQHQVIGSCHRLLRMKFRYRSYQ